MMKIVLFVSLALASVSAFDNSDDFINEINSKQNLWKAGRNFDENTPSSAIQGLLGIKTLPKEIFEKIPLKYHDVQPGDLPQSFDAREKWSKCRSVSEVADQSSCGSSWAVAVATTISDRICIHSDGKLQTEISARNLLACNNARTMGCKGGNSIYSWQFWQEVGIVTGGPYGSKIGCQPYSFAPCEHHTTGSKPPCPPELYPTPKCVNKCDNSTIDYKADLNKGGSVYSVFTFDEEQIRAEIFKNGPVTTEITIYEDFLHYKSGVYTRTSNTSEGRLAVRVIGWGEENRTKYWLVANSWNEDWGDKGFFKIRRGSNECGIEVQVIAGLPKPKPSYFN